MLTNATALTSENESDVIAANQQIMTNSGIPTQNGKTTNWCEIKQAYNQNFYYIIKPDAEGWTPEGGEKVSQAQMMENVANVTEQPFDTDWWPPINPQE